MAAYLQAALGSDTPVVKACNNLSAYTLGHADAYADTLQTAVASDCPAAGRLVGDLLRSMGIQVSHQGCVGESPGAAVYACAAVGHPGHKPGPAAIILGVSLLATSFQTKAC